jgi:hypothetical protein
MLKLIYILLITTMLCTPAWVRFLRMESTVASAIDLLFSSVAEAVERLLASIMSDRRKWFVSPTL